jgi:fumarate hydratase class I
MADFQYQELFELGPDETPYRKLTDQYVSTVRIDGREILKVDPAALTMLAAQAIRDVSHLFRPGHLAQLAKILDDPEASGNDRFVALDLLKNAGIAAGGSLPMCQDTGTAIVMGKKGRRLVTGHDEEALSRGIYKTYAETNLRYSPARAARHVQGEEHRHEPAGADRDLRDDRREYEFLFMAKGGGSANKSYLFQETKALLNPKSLKKFFLDKIRTLGTAACPPYHLAS